MTDETKQEQVQRRGETEIIMRPGVRVLVIDTAERVLLFRTLDPEGRPFWYPPGGGAEPGESAEETARRELLEETGQRQVELGPEIWWRRGIAAWGGHTYDCHERWFLARVAPFEVDTAGFTPDERASIAGHRWWTVAELRATPDRLVPQNLAALVSALLRDGPPHQPVQIMF